MCCGALTACLDLYTLQLRQLARNILLAVTVTRMLISLSASVSPGMAAVSGHMATVGRVYISTDDLDCLRAARALCPALRARQPLREQLNVKSQASHAQRARCQLNDALWTRASIFYALELG